MKEVDFNKKQFEIWNLFDPYFTPHALIEIFEELKDFSINECMNPLLIVLNSYNQQIKKAIEILLIRIWYLIKVLDIQIVSEIKSEIKIRIHKYVKRKFHHEVIKAEKKDNSEIKRQIFTIEYDPDVNHISKNGKMNCWIIYDPVRYIIELSKQEINNISSMLEHYGQPHNVVGLQYKYNKITKSMDSYNNFTLKPLKCQNIILFSNYDEIWTKVCKLKRNQLHKSKVISSIEHNNKLGQSKIINGSLTTFDWKSENIQLKIFLGITEGFSGNL